MIVRKTRNLARRAVDAKKKKKTSKRKKGYGT